MTGASSMVALLRRFPLLRARPAVRPGASIERVLAEIDAAIRRRVPLGAVLKTLDGCRRPLFLALGDCVAPRPAAKLMTLKLLNLCLAKYHFLARDATVVSRPLNLTADPSNACHLACPGCVHSRTAEERGLFLWRGGMLPEARYRTLLDAFGPCAIHATFCNYGEPLLNPATPRFIRRAKRFLIATSLSTNLSLRRFDAEALVESGLDLLIVSIDGASQPVYEKFRRNGDLGLALANLAKLVVAKRAMSKPTPVIAWHFLAFEHNAHEIPKAMETAREIGVNEFRVVRPFDVTWDDPAVRAAPVPHFNVQFDAGSERAIMDNRNPFPGELDEDLIDREFATPWSERARELPDSGPQDGATCQWLYKNITMDAGGRILPCCCAPQPDADVVFGDVASGGDLFNSTMYRLARLSFSDRRAFAMELEKSGTGRRPYCANCEWNKSWADPNRVQIEEYLKAAAGGALTRRALAVLRDW